MITRFAPTPSGYLHEGNAVNALLVNWWAATEDGTVLLRIDDMDATRARPEYVTDAHEVLAWLGIGWTPAPRVAVADYRAALSVAEAEGLQVYACSCSRRQLAGVVPRGGCPAGCRTDPRPYVAGETALRVHVPIGTTVRVGDTDVDLAARVGDFVVWRRDDLPAYHLASVVDDVNHGVTDIVRGLDLLESTAAQLFLARPLGEHFSRTRFIHHDLLLGPNGAKLSKSQAGRGRPLPRTDEGRQQLIDTAQVIGGACGISPGDALRSLA